MGKTRRMGEILKIKKKTNIGKKNSNEKKSNQSPRLGEMDRKSKIGKRDPEMLFFTIDNMRNG